MVAYAALPYLVVVEQEWDDLVDPGQTHAEVDVADCVEAPEERVVEVDDGRHPETDVAEE